MCKHMPPVDQPYRWEDLARWTLPPISTGDLWSGPVCETCRNAVGSVQAHAEGELYKNERRPRPHADERDGSDWRTCRMAKKSQDAATSGPGIPQSRRFGRLGAVAQDLS